MEGHQLMDWLRSRWGWIVRNKSLTLIIVFVVGFLIFGVVMVCRHWGWIVTESGSTIIRNLGLVIGGFVAIVFGIWRGNVAYRQSKASQDQAKTARLGLLNERYQKGAEMLGSRARYVLVGGIYALTRLAQENPDQYRDQVEKLLSAFIESPPLAQEGETPSAGGNFDFSNEVEIAKEQLELLQRNES